MTLPQDVMIEQTLQYEPFASFLCTQASFYDMRPELLTEETEDYRYI